MYNEGKVISIDIKKEMKTSYIDYAMSVIVGRALPDVRDGLKPVHRRILYSMQQLGLSPEKGYRKCARIVGDVLGKYHPHGDSSVYDALVRLAQDFSIRYLLVDGHGNFGSVDGDSAAAMRYTEAKLAKIAVEMLRDIGKETVDFVDNFDGEEREPSVLPSRYPNLLVNGSSGIAVGMATNIPPHNLKEVIDGVILLIDNADATVLDLMAYIKGPDFPTSGTIMGVSGIREAYETGRGKVIVRAKSDIEEENGRQKIIITELPYMVNKARLIENIADHVKEKKLTGISDLRDESDRDGMRIVIELKKDANAHVILNYLYKHTKVQDTFGIIMLSLVNNEPKVLNLREMLVHYLNFQKQVVTRRTIFELAKAEERAHILEGLLIALDNIDEVVKILRGSKTTDIAKNELMTRFGLSDRQAVAILDMRLRRLTGLERDKIVDEFDELMIQIARLKEILGSEAILLGVIREELIEIRDKYGDERRTRIEKKDDEINYEDLISEEDVVITLTQSGYIKRIQAATYSSQKRGGRGIQAMSTKEDDIVSKVFVTSTHKNLLFFTSKGKVYKLKAYEIPDAGRVSKGTNLVNIIPLDQDEKIQAVISIADMDQDGFLVFCTANGIVKKTGLEDYSNIRKNGLIAINLREGDELLNVKFTRGDADLILVTQDGYSIKFNENEIRTMGRTASGVKGIDLRSGDTCVSFDIAVEGEDLLVVSESGLGKRTPISEYHLQRRGGKGLITYKVSSRTGPVVGARSCSQDDELMLINSDGVAIRISIAEISETSRNTMGVKLMKTSETTKVVSMAKIIAARDEEGPEVEEIDSDETISKGIHDDTDDSDIELDVYDEDDSDEESEE
ncbi:DNA gyrase subunit A [Youngiibacter fragilis 232.1]|uniref:DNA gyrase subunit A n=3 Tax=Youngiibacter TaxID=1408818 RepID=V7I7T2_9CLOT|nr:DNA gyrase subunit A [Youngiibacter fragilis]ETA81331.1 DNA gyrase subunit A [Youngiibacter fragilis 232.1]